MGRHEAAETGESWWSLVEEHLGLVASALLTVLLCIRIVVVSEFDRTTAIALAYYVPTSALILGTLLDAIYASLPIMLGVVLIVSLRRPKVSRLPTRLSLATLAIIGLAMYSLFIFVSLSLALVLLHFGLKRMDAKAARAGRVPDERIMMRSLIPSLVISAAVTALSVPSLGFPVENIEVKGEQAISGYVLRDDPELVVLQREQGTVARFRVIDIVDREICESLSSGEGRLALLLGPHRTLPELMRGAPITEYPVCVG